MTAAPDVAVANANAAPDLGVLFVHGIGNQITGQTVVQFGDPVLQWLDEWLRFSSKLPPDEVAKLAAKEVNELPHQLNVSEARLRTDGGIPAHTHVEIGVTPDNNGQPQRWIMAESCWANAFVPPSFRALALWGLIVYPWTNATHYGSLIRRQWSTVSESKGRLRRAIAITRALLIIAFLLVVSVPISILVVAILALLLVLAIPPIPSLRAMLLRVQQALADTLGDSFILAASQIQRAAIISHVRRDLEWLVSQRCAKIAVIGHSQGAAVSFEALCTGVLRKFCESKPVDSDSSAPQLKETMLITFGSGLAKLRELERVLITDRAKLGWMPIGGLALIALSLEFFKVINLIPFVEPSFGLGIFCALFGVLFWIGGVASGAKDRPLPDDFEPQRKFGCQTKWRDYYASNDPVPNGPLFDEDQPFLKSEKVHNFASMFRDHTTYWLNRDQFVPAIIGDLAELSQLPLLDLRPGDEQKIQTAAKRRAGRVQWLAYATSAIWIMVAVVIITRWNDLPQVGAVLLSQLPLLEKILRWFGIKEISNGEFATSFLAQDVAGIIAALLCAVLASQVIRLVWQLWTRRDTRALLRRESYGSELPRWLFLVVALAIIDAGVLVSMGLPGTIAPPTPKAGGGWIVYILVPGSMAGGLMYLWRLIRGRDSAGATFWPAAVTTLLVAPVMALLLTIEMNEWYRFGIVMGLIGLGWLLLLEVERKFYAACSNDVIPQSKSNKHSALPLEQQKS
jgi:hypothetical protein